MLGHRKAEEHVGEEEGSVEGIVKEEEGKVKDDEAEDSQADVWFLKEESDELEKAYGSQHSQDHHQQEGKPLEREVEEVLSCCLEKQI